MLKKNRLLVGLFLVIALSFGSLPFGHVEAFADVRKADVIVDDTVEARGLTVAECPSIESEYAALMDSSGNVYFSRDGMSSAQIASITKVMTAIVAIDHPGHEQDYVVSESAAEIGESTAGLEAGDVLDFESVLKALLVPSGNDAALTIAETIGAEMAEEQGSTKPVQAFVDAMNAKAQELGCENTVYENPHGLDDDTHAGTLHSCAIDQLKVARCAMEYDQIRSIVGAGDTTIVVERDGKDALIELESTDELLETYDYAIGIKTGMTDLAGYSFMGAASKEGRELYAVLLNADDETQRFKDAKVLFEWYYDHVKQLDLAQSDVYTTMDTPKISGEVPVVAAVAHKDWPDKTVMATLADPDAQISVFDLEGNVSQSIVFDDLMGTIDAGDKVGKITYRQHNMVVAEQDLIACERVSGPNPFESIAIMWQRFLAGFSGEPTEAESQVYNVMPVIDNNRSSSA